MEHESTMESSFPTSVVKLKLDNSMLTEDLLGINLSFFWVDEGHVFSLACFLSHRDFTEDLTGVFIERIPSNSVISLIDVFVVIVYIVKNLTKETNINFRY